MTTALTHAPAHLSHALTASDVAAQSKLIQEIMQAVMKDGQHYGKIPGCGDKPALFKAGAEKLSVTFRLAPSFEKTEVIDMGNGHREYRITTRLTHMDTGKFIGEGVGSCSTLESKYRYRQGGKPVATDKPVPKLYWDKKKGGDMSAAQALLGGAGFRPLKMDDGSWMIAKVDKAERVENPDIADQWNTVWKMAKKRSLVDATITATGASDCFTQDIEERIGELAEFIDLPPESAKVVKDAAPKEPPRAGPDRSTTHTPAPVEGNEPFPPRDPPGAPTEPTKSPEGSQPDPEDAPQTWQAAVIPVGTHKDKQLGTLPKEDIEALYRSFKHDPKNQRQVNFKLALLAWHKETDSK